MRRRKGEDPALFYIQIHPKHFSTRQTVDRPTIDMVRETRRGRERKPDRVRLMFPRAMEVVSGSFSMETPMADLYREAAFPKTIIAGEPRMRLEARVKVGKKIFTLTMQQEGI